MSGGGGEISEAEEEAWIAERRAQVAEYLAAQGVKHGQIGDWPAWHIPPIVSIWAIESLAKPGWVGWWAISGDLPTDYCTVEEPRHPRTAAATFAASWRTAAQDVRPDGTLGDTGLPSHLGPMLFARAEVMERWAQDDDIWPE